MVLKMFLAKVLNVENKITATSSSSTLCTNVCMVCVFYISVNTLDPERVNFTNTYINVLF